MFLEDRIWMAKGENRCHLLLNQANRHGLIAGASGTGKTVTLKVMAEGFSKAGVPVFLADAKGDVRGMCQPGADNEKMQARIAKFGIENWTYEGCPCHFWNILDGDSMPVRITISEMGPTLLSRLLGLTDVQEGVLNIVFRIADEQNMLLIDLKDLRAMLNYVSENSKEIGAVYGNVASASVGAILRALIAVEDQGGDKFFGEPALDLQDWFVCDENGHGYVNILDARGLIQSPAIYSMFLLWMMSELFETLPEVGDLNKPKFVFFFDEAHLLFNGMPKELLSKIVQVVKLIRSKGVGIYFITQSPSDIPDEVLAQLSNRVQHGLRAYTPAEQKAVKVAAQSFRPNPAFKSEDAIMDLGTGEALVSFLDEEGRPSIVENAKILPPQCLMAAPEQNYVDAVLAGQKDLMDKYGTAIDRHSAFEDLFGDPQPAEAAPAEGAGAATAAAGSEAAAPQEPSPAGEAAAAPQQTASADPYAGMTATQRMQAQIKARKEAEAAAKAGGEAPASAEPDSGEGQKPAAQTKESKADATARKKAEIEAAKAKQAEERRKAQTAKEIGKVANNIGKEATRQIFRGIFNALKK